MMEVSEILIEVEPNVGRVWAGTKAMAKVSKSEEGEHCCGRLNLAVLKWALN